MSKLFSRIAWTCIIAFIIFLICNFTGIISRDNYINKPVLVAFIFIVPVVFGGTFAILSLSFAMNRTTYLARIKQYRQLKAFRDIMDYIYVRDFEAAADAYNNRLKHGYQKDFMFGYFLGASLTSDDSERLEKTSKRLKGIYDSFNPANIDFNK